MYRRVQKILNIVLIVQLLVFMGFSPIFSSETYEFQKNKFQEEFSPYKILTSLVENSGYLSFAYMVYRPISETTETGYFFQKNHKKAALFTSSNVRGEMVLVREVERDGRVYYIMEEEKRMVSFLSPAMDFLFDDMLEITATPLKDFYVEDSYTIYLYERPFEHDESIFFQYRFLLQGDDIESLEIFMGDHLQSIYKFSEFSHEEFHEEIFSLPVGYDEERLDYSYDGDHAPPWWSPPLLQ